MTNTKTSNRNQIRKLSGHRHMSMEKNNMKTWQTRVETHQANYKELVVNVVSPEIRQCSGLTV